METITLRLSKEWVANGDFIDGLGRLALAVLLLDQVESLRRHVSLIQRDVELLLGDVPRWGPTVLARLVSGITLLEMLGEKAPDLSALNAANQSDACVRLQRELALRSLPFAGKASRAKGVPRTRQAYLKRLESLPTEAALELALCHGHPNHAAYGHNCALLLARNRQRELALAGEERRLEEIVQWGTRWQDRKHVAGWQIAEPGAYNSAARAFLVRDSALTIYHWAGFCADCDDLADWATDAVAFAAAPSLDGFESNPLAVDAAERALQHLDAASTTHLLVVDFGLSPLKASHFGEITEGAGLRLEVADLLSV